VGRFEGVIEFADFVDRGDGVIVPGTARLHGRENRIQAS
jgi:hypothetical protein